MRFQRDSLLKEPLHVRVIRLWPVTGNTDGAPTIDLLEPFNDRTQVIAEVLTISRHVINCEDRDALYSVLSDPLRSNQFG